MCNSEDAFLGAGCGGIHGWSLGYSCGSLLGIRPGVNTGFGNRIIAELALGGEDVVYMDSSNFFRNAEDLEIMSGKIFRRRINE